MNKLISIRAAVALAIMTVGLQPAAGGTPVELLSYSLPDGSGGMKFATRQPGGENWKSFGNGWTLLGSDFGAWGSGKKMHNVRMAQDDAGRYWVVFNPDKEGEVTAFTWSPDLETWMPQEYRRSDSGFERELPQELSLPELTEAEVAGQSVKGSVMTVDSDMLERLEGFMHYRGLQASKNSERTDQDPWRFKNLRPLTATITLDKGGAKPISDELIGIFFEDINYGADGGLYAELVRNRDFEFSSKDRGDWTPTTGWEAADSGTLNISDKDPIHPNNPHYVTLTRGKAILNGGFDGIVVKKGEKYLFKVFARSQSKAKLKVSLLGDMGKTIGETTLAIPGGNEWTELRATLTGKYSYARATLQVAVVSGNEVSLDMVSLFPENTFKGRENGLREDLALTLADLKPKFMRFPGGCVSHGNGIDNIYDWKGSIGPLESRKPLPNLWGYHQTRGLGFYEFFQFCEDLGMQPLPVLAAGVPCQNSSRASACSHDVLTSNGQQGGIPMEDMPAYIADILDLVEYANGPVDSEWGKQRADAGHPEPFGMKYLGVGNEDLISEAFKERFKMIKDAVNAKYPEITVVGTVGPFFEGSDYEEGWKFAREEDVAIVDEHYYVEPGWYVNHRDFYDSYDRRGPKVYLGEYASHLPGRVSNLEAALSIALYLTDVERNADVVTMTSYAPLLSKKNRTQWRPDLIYFDNEEIRLTPDYYVQQMYGVNSGNVYLPAEIELKEDGSGKRVSDDVWNRFGVSTVIDEKSGDVILKIANMLPVSIAMNLEGYPSGKATVTRLAGKPGQTEIVPESSEVYLERELKAEPYSFTVVRMESK